MWRGRGKRRKQQLDRSLLLYRFLGQQLLDIRGGGGIYKGRKAPNKKPKTKSEIREVAHQQMCMEEMRNEKFVN
jgi:hypothetical protein